METSPVLLLCILTFLVGTVSAKIPYHPEDDNHDDKDCDPYDKKPCKGGNQRCHDDDGDGHFKCECEFNFFIKDEHGDGNCVLGACPYEDDDSGWYRTVDDKCYFFEKKQLDFQQAIANCKKKFPFNGRHNGRLWEPVDEKHDIKVVAMAKKMNHKNKDKGHGGHWIGIRKQVHTGETKPFHFYYASKKPEEPELYDGWANGEPNDLDFKEDCVGVGKNNIDQWGDFECIEKMRSICEVDQERGCGLPEYANDAYCDTENNHAGCNWDGGACCDHLAHNNPNSEWDNYCKGEKDCECLDPAYERTPPCEDKWPAKKCKKCKKKCKTSKACSENCKFTCDHC